jgi:hypothetical protein
MDVRSNLAKRAILQTEAANITCLLALMLAVTHEIKRQIRREFKKIKDHTITLF